MFRLPLESSFMMALEHNRFKALDHIYTKHMVKCLPELVTRIKTDPVLNRKWNLYLGLDLYLPTMLVWLLLRERSKADVKRRLAKPKGFPSLPYF